MDPQASRETLDHSIMYIFAVALQDGVWHHVNSYTPARAQRPDTVALWHKISTVEDPVWTKRYHSTDPAEKAFGARVVVTMNDGSVFEDELALANAHPDGARPFERAQYINKFNVLTDGILSNDARAAFLDLVQRLPELTNDELLRLNPKVDAVGVQSNAKPGIF